MKLALIFNIASHYREVIYSLIDKKYDCHWYFRHNDGDIAEFDTSKLSCVTRYATIGNPERVYWQRGLLRQLFDRQSDAIFMLGEVRSLTVWAMVLFKRLFRLKKPLYCWSHGPYGREGNLRIKLERWRYNAFDGIFLYNCRAKELLTSYGVSADKIHVIANSLSYYSQLEMRHKLKPTDIYRQHFGNNNPTLIFIGRLTKVKQLDLAIQALTELTNVNLVLVGGGEEGDNLRALAQDLNVLDRVWFYGPCYDEATNAELIYNADLCVAPGNVGLTAMHTMVFGTPVVTHDDLAWQMPEFEAIIPGKTGCFFKRNNVESLTGAVREWIDGPGLKREEIRRNCYKEIDTKWNPNYQMDIITQYIK